MSLRRESDGWGFMRFDAFVALALFALTGCVSPPDPSADDALNERGNVANDATIPAPSPTDGAPPQFEAQYSFVCTQTRLFVHVDLKHAQSFLPAGWIAGDASRATSLLQPGSPSIPTGYGMVGYDLVVCPDGTVNGTVGSMNFSNLAVLVESPKFPDGTTFPAVNLEIYDVDLFADAGTAWTNLLEATQWGSLTPNVTIEVGFGPLGIAGPGHAGINVDGLPVSEVTWGSTPGVHQGPILVRFWHQSDFGTVTGGAQLYDELGIGEATSCYQAPGSAFEDVLGQSDCVGLRSLVVTGLASDIGGTLTWMPGAYAVDA